jgi:hypothetical protein
MLRTLALTLVLAASAPTEQFPHSAMNLLVQGHEGAVLGRITAVERDEFGEIVAVEIPGLEPPDAPRDEVIAEDRSFENLMRARSTDAAPG